MFQNGGKSSPEGSSERVPHTRGNFAKQSKRLAILRSCPIPARYRVKRQEESTSVDQVVKRPEGSDIFRYVFLFSSVLVLPGIQWPLLFWLNGFVPLLTFFLLYGFGWNTGNRIIVLGVVCAFVISGFLQILPFFLLAMTSVPAGYVIARSAERSEGPISAAAKGVLALGACWLIFWGGLAVVNSAFSYSSLIHSVQDRLDMLLKQYRHNTSIPVDTLIVIDQMLSRTKTLFPVIFPAIVSNFVLLTIWFTMVLGNRLALKHVGRSPWPEYRFWRLPDKLIWAEIISAVLALLPIEPLGTIGVNLLILVSVLFIFQGLSIVVYFFNKWNMPVIFRLPLYILAVIQSSGTLVLLIIGIADIWLDLRRLNH